MIEVFCDREVERKSRRSAAVSLREGMVEDAFVDFAACCSAVAATNLAAKVKRMTENR